MPSMSRGDDRVEHEGVPRTVPGNVDPAHQATIVSGAHPAEAVTVDLPPPVPLIAGLALEALGMKMLYLSAIERAPPLVVDHAGIVGAGRINCGTTSGQADRSTAQDLHYLRNSTCSWRSGFTCT